MLKKISIKYGEKQVFDGMDFYTFPTVEHLSNASENGLRECGLGYRAKYVHATAKRIRDENMNLEQPKELALSRSPKKTLRVFRRGIESS